MIYINIIIVIIILASGIHFLHLVVVVHLEKSLDVSKDVILILKLLLVTLDSIRIVIKYILVLYIHYVK